MDTETDSEAVSPERAVMIRLRARLAVVERAAWFGFVQALRTQPEATRAYIEAERARCVEGFGTRGWASDLTASERAMLGAEVDSGLAGLLADGAAEIG